MILSRVWPRWKIKWLIPTKNAKRDSNKQTTTSSVKGEIETNNQQLQDAKWETESNNQLLQDAKQEIECLGGEKKIFKEIHVMHFYYITYMATP